tara:strand:+ start:1729 stop:1998 length:270 start_codon:yes stop_codon:yes gene_type:complete
MNKLSSNISSLDGYPRDKTDDQNISLNFVSLFSSPAGAEVLKYLRSVTIEAVHGSAVTNDTLRHAEGQRYIVGLIERRIQHGHKVKSNE